MTDGPVLRRLGGALRERYRRSRPAWRDLLHDRLWVGAPPAAAAGFAVLFLVALALGEEPAGEALRLGAMGAGFNLLGWALGIRAAHVPEEPDAGDGEEKLPRRIAASRTLAMLVAAGAVLFMVGGVDLLRLLAGRVEWQRTVVAVVSKSMMVACIVVPVRLRMGKS